jgi:hypothetical protein
MHRYIFPRTAGRKDPAFHAFIFESDVTRCVTTVSHSEMWGLRQKITIGVSNRRSPATSAVTF